MRIYHTNATTSHVGSNHDGAFASLELVQDPIALILLLITVDCQARPSVLAKESGDFVGSSLGSGKDQTLAGLVVHNLLKVLDETVTL